MGNAVVEAPEEDAGEVTREERLALTRRVVGVTLITDAEVTGVEDKGEVGVGLPLLDGEEEAREELGVEEA